MLFTPVQKVLHWGCHFLPSSLYQWRHKQGWHVWQKYEIRHEQTFSVCYLLAKRKPKWLRPEELDFEAKQVNNQTKQNNNNNNNNNKGKKKQQPSNPVAYRYKYWHILYVFRPVCVFRFYFSQIKSQISDQKVQFRRKSWKMPGRNQIRQITSKTLSSVFITHVTLCMKRTVEKVKLNEPGVRVL